MWRFVFFFFTGDGLGSLSHTESTYAERPAFAVRKLSLNKSIANACIATEVSRKSMLEPQTLTPQPKSCFASFMIKEQVLHTQLQLTRCCQGDWTLPDLGFRPALSTD